MPTSVQQFCQQPAPEPPPDPEFHFPPLKVWRDEVSNAADVFQITTLATGDMRDVTAPDTFLRLLVYRFEPESDDEGMDLFFRLFHNSLRPATGQTSTALAQSDFFTSGTNTLITGQRLSQRLAARLFCVFFSSKRFFCSFFLLDSRFWRENLFFPLQVQFDDFNLPLQLLFETLQGGQNMFALLQQFWKMAGGSFDYG